jgi:hypothetical protein
MKAKRKRTPEERAEDRRRGERVERLLRARIAYHDAKLREERPGWIPPQNSDEWQAYYEARWAAERAAPGNTP